MRIAITGAHGQLGSELCRLLGQAAIPLDQPQFDLTDVARTKQALLDARPDGVIHTAAYTLVDRAEQEAERAHQINADALEPIVDACGQLNCWLAQISTDYVFGADSTRSIPYREDDTPGPLNVYGHGKLAAERIVASHAWHYIVRTCGLYGLPGQRTATSSFVQTMLRLGRERGEVRVVDDQWCCPSFVPHVARAIAFLVGTNSHGIYHVVNGGATTWRRLAEYVFQRAGLDVRVMPITTAEYGALARRPGYSVLDNSKYHALGGPPMPGWQAGVDDYLQMLADAGPSPDVP